MAGVAQLLELAGRVSSDAFGGENERFLGSATIPPFQSPRHPTLCIKQLVGGTQVRFHRESDPLPACPDRLSQVRSTKRSCFTVVTMSKADPGRPDPRDNIAVRERLTRANALMVALRQRSSAVAVTTTPFPAHALSIVASTDDGAARAALAGRSSDAAAVHAPAARE